MKVLWFSWKDIHHPLAGGAEAVSYNIMKRLAEDGHQVRLITARYAGSTTHEVVDGIEIFRVGNKLSVYPKAFFLFRRQMASWPDLMIDEMNTIPFGCALYSRQRSVLFTYQLARKVWFYQASFPISVIGYLFEPVYLLLMSRFYQTVLTESKSTCQDLQNFGFRESTIHLVRVGIEIKPTPIPLSKKTNQTILVLGAIRPMKQTLDAVKAFELARDNNPALKLILAGNNSGKYADMVQAYCKSSTHAKAISLLGRVSKDRKTDLLRQSALILVTSIKEGWGLIVTEANSQGTPAIAYNNDGLRDSIMDSKTGILTEPGNINDMANAINSILSAPEKLQAMSFAAYQYSQQFTYENSYDDFTRKLGITPTKQYEN